jgi:ornithine cyclodeaminase
MLILNETDILSAIDIGDLLKSTEKALLLQEGDDFYMPDRMHLEHEGHVNLLMPAIAGDYISTKLVSVFPENRKLNKPSLYGAVILQDGKTGEPLALLNGSKLTALRTGAVGALGLAYTSPKNLESIGLAGAGVQGYHQALFACSVRNIRKINIYDPYNKDIKTFIGRLKALLPEVDITDVKDLSAFVKQSEAIITATTSLTPVLPDEPELLRDKHFIGIGSYRPDMREFPDGLFSLLKEVIIDTPLATKESGDLSQPLRAGLIRKEQVHSLGKLVNRAVTIDDAQTTFFKSVGMALFDLTAAEAIYTTARQKGIGQEVEF